MASFLAMGKRETWYAIGFVTDKLLRALKETARREKIIENMKGGTGEAESGKTSSPARTAGENRGRDTSGTEN